MKIHLFSLFRKLLFLCVLFWGGQEIALAAPQKAESKVAKVSAMEKRILRKVFDHKTSLPLAPSVRKKLSPLPRDLVIWWEGLRGEGSFQEIAGCLLRHPHWPRSHLLQKEAEGKIDESVTQKELDTFFKHRPPLTSAGKVAYLELLDRKKEIKKACLLVRQYWQDGMIFWLDGQKITLPSRLTAHLNKEDHRKRLHSFMSTPYTIDIRNAMLGLKNSLSSEERRVLEHYMDLIENQPGAGQSFKKLPLKLQQRKTLLKAYVFWMHKNKLMHELNNFFLRSPLARIDPNGLWSRYHLYAAREAFQKKKYQLAYNLVKNHRLTKVSAYADAEWFLGWISLRFLKKPQQAHQHFTRFLAVVKTPISLARGHYWTGRTFSAMKGKKKEARQHYQKASVFKSTFYGQLASAKIGHPLAPVLRACPPLKPQHREKFYQQESVRIAHFLNECKITHTKPAHLFLANLVKTCHSREDALFLIGLASELAPRSSVSIARELNTRIPTLPLFKEAYPVPPLPKRIRPEHRSLVYAIIYKETRFNPHAKGDAGERGIMQIMAETAKEIACHMGIHHKHTPERMFDEQYNISLGGFHAAYLMKNYKNFKPLVVAAYNAGEGNVGNWIKKLGQPSKLPHDKLVDWLESIPFPGTRDYVQRVLETVNIYGGRLKHDSRHRCGRLFRS